MAHDTSTRQAIESEMADKWSTIPTYILEERFEESDSGGALGSATDGYDSSLINAVVSGTGTIDPDSTTAYSGTYSCSIQAVSGESNYIEYDLGQEYTTLGFHMVFRRGVSFASRNCVVFKDSSFNTVGKINGGSSNVIQFNGSGFTTNGLSSSSTFYHIWVDHVSGSEATVCFSTDSTKPTSGNEHATTATPAGTGGIRYIRIGIENKSGTSYVDEVFASSSSIGSNPAGS